MLRSRGVFLSGVAGSGRTRAKAAEMGGERVDLTDAIRGASAVLWEAFENHRNIVALRPTAIGQPQYRGTLNAATAEFETASRPERRSEG